MSYEILYSTRSLHICLLYPHSIVHRYIILGNRKIDFYQNKGTYPTPFQNYDTNISDVVIHSTEPKHTIEFDNIKVLATTDNYFVRTLILESKEIRKHKNNVNRDSDFELSNIWKPVLQKLNSATWNNPLEAVRTLWSFWPGLHRPGRIGSN